MRLCVDAQDGECEIICSYEKSGRLIDHCGIDPDGESTRGWVST